MYQDELWLTDEVKESVNMYADNIPAVEGTMLDVALPLRKQHFEVKKNDLLTSTLDRPGMNEILFPKKQNKVIDVMVLEPVVSAEEGKIDLAKVFELVLENPMEEVSEEANKPMFTSLEPEILEIDAEGNLTAKVELGQTEVVIEWPSGVIAQILVTIGEVSEVKPAVPELGGDVVEDEEVVEPEQPEGGETPEEPEPENPSEPENPEPEPEEPKEEEPVAEAKIMYGLMPIADHMESIDAITAEDLAAVEYTKVEVAAMEKTNIPVNENDILVILIPADSALVATRDNGVGTKVAFMEDIIGCNGQKTYTIEGIEYKLYAEFQTVGATGYYFYVD